MLSNNISGFSPKINNKNKNQSINLEGPFLELSKAKLIYLGIAKAKFLSREKLKQLKITLQKDRILAIKELSKLLIPLTKSKQMIKLLMSCGLDRRMVFLVLKIIKKLFLELFKKPFTLTDISELSSVWLKIPLQIRRLIIAIIELKQEMLHKFLRDLREIETKRIKLNKKIGISNSKTELYENLKHTSFEDFGLTKGMIESTTAEEKIIKKQKFLKNFKETYS